MRESTTYKAILEEGREIGRRESVERGRREEAMRLLALLGTRRFDAPSSTTMLVLERSSLPELERIFLRLLTAESWSELLDG